MKSIVAVSLCLLLLGSSADSAGAACDFEHPRKAGSFSSSLVQAYLSCGGGINTTTEGGVPACKPPESFHTLSGSPPNGWLWDERKGQGQVSFRAAKNKVAAFLSQANTADLSVQMSLKGVIMQGSQGPGTGDGTLGAIARATFEDRSGGGTALTVVDFPASFPFTMTAGKAKVKTSANVMLNGIGQPGLPGCASIELIAVFAFDPYGDAFASLGTFLPDLPQ